MHFFRNIFLFFALVFTLLPENSSIKAQNVLFCTDTTVASDAIFSYRISYSNYSNITGFQFDLTIPEDITFLCYSAIPSRYTDHQVMVSKIEANKIRVLCFSASNSSVKNSSAALLTLDLRSGTHAGKYRMEISNAIVVASSGKNILDSVSNGSITVSALSRVNEGNNSNHIFGTKQIDTDQIKVYPNPFNNSAMVSYFASSPLPVKMELLNIQGRCIYEDTLFPSNTGWNSGIIKMTDYPSGTYFARIIQKERSSVKKILLIK